MLYFTEKKNLKNSRKYIKRQIVIAVISQLLTVHALIYSEKTPIGIFATIRKSKKANLELR